MTPKQNVYRVVVYEVSAELGESGVTTVETPVASFATENMTGHDAIMRVADQLADEEAS
jgi:hypothetical protein